MNIKTIGKVILGIAGMGIAYIASAECGNFAKDNWDKRNDEPEGLVIDKLEPAEEVNVEVNESED